jgi:dTDP-4-amino-4,6-dideoxygalactose transaminase
MKTFTPSHGLAPISRVPFADLSHQWDPIADKAMAELRQLFSESAFSLGPWVDRFERSVADYLGTPHAIGVNSGTSALHLALIAAGIGPSDEVLLPSHTFIATAWAVLYVGATPVLCDVEAESGTIDVADAAQRISAATRAIIPVHLYGQPADMAAVMKLAERHGLVVIEDTAQAIGAVYDGKSAGSLGRFGCFSFYPAKNLGAAGEAGLVITSDDAAATRMRALRHHAQSERYVHAELGFNYRMEGVQGLVLGHKLQLLPNWIEERKALANAYGERLLGLPLALPRVVHQDHVFHLYVVRTPERDALRAFLQARGIETGLHYPVPLHRQPCFAGLRLDRDSFPVSDRYAGECLSLPLFTGMERSQLDYVCDSTRAYYEKS